MGDYQMRNQPAVGKTPLETRPPTGAPSLQAPRGRRPGYRRGPRRALNTRVGAQTTRQKHSCMQA
eukprot:6412091-Pyramimonas_sp.AAC.1